MKPKQIINKQKTTTTTTCYNITPPIIINNRYMNDFLIKIKNNKKLKVKYLKKKMINKKKN